MTASLPPLDDLVACPHCDTLHVARELAPGATAYCQRCHAPLMSARPQAIARIFSLALTAMVLMFAAISFPFLDLDVQGQHNATSVIGAIMAFNGGLSVPLAIAVAMFIVVLPLMRLLALAFALGPLALGRSPFRLAGPAFALAESLRPWAMAEIFMVGVTVALIKVAGLANVTIGPAFWAFAGLVVIMALKDQFISRYSVWEELNKAASRS